MVPSKATAGSTDSNPLSALTVDFRELAAKAGMQVEAGRASAVWEQGLFFAASGAQAKPTKGGAVDVGLVRFSTPKDLALRTRDGLEVPPGSYVVRIAKNGSVALRPTGGGAAIPTSPAGTAQLEGGGGIFECSGAYRIEVQYSNCRVCITLVCPGQWVYLIGCLDIPFCGILTGLFTSTS